MLPAPGWTHFFCFFCSGIIQQDVVVVSNEGNFVTALRGTKQMTQIFGGELFCQPVRDADSRGIKTEQFGILSLRHCWLVIQADKGTTMNNSQEQRPHVFPIVRFISYSTIYRRAISCFKVHLADNTSTHTQLVQQYAPILLPALLAVPVYLGLGNLGAPF